MEEMSEEERDEEPKRKRCTRQSLCSWGPGWKTAAWFAVMAVYLLFGGLVFSLAERPNELARISEAQDQRKELQAVIVEAREAVVGALTARNDSLSIEEALELVEIVANVSASLALASRELPSETSPLWTYAPSIFFSATVITTIGYGLTAPVTDLGRTLFIFYAIFGIPICLIFLGLLGDRLSSYINSLSAYVTSKTEGRPEKHRVKIHTLFYITLFILGLTLFIFFPSIIFSAVEGWTYPESVYYCFVTLSAVGFGDFVPAQAISSDVNDLYRICSAAWILVGLAWVALLVTKTQKHMVAVESHLYSTVREKRRKYREREKEKELKVAKTTDTTQVGEAEERTSGDVLMYYELLCEGLLE